MATPTPPPPEQPKTPPPAADTPPPRPVNDVTNAEANQWSMFIHLSQLANFLVPLLGVVLPIVLWQVKKDEFPSSTAHAYVVINWLISALIYSIVSGILTIILIGFLGLLVVGILGIVFPIIGGIKANEGEIWEYPLTIRFLK